MRTWWESEDALRLVPWNDNDNWLFIHRFLVMLRRGNHVGINSNLLKHIRNQLDWRCISSDRVHYGHPKLIIGKGG